MMSNPSTHNVPHGHSAADKPRTPPPVVVRAGSRSNRASDEECERLLDEELTGTFPASDPPSWTMGGSRVSMLRH